VHIFVDTGMHREGVSMEGLPGFLEGLKKLKNIEVEGLMSHLAEPVNPESGLTKTQVENFLKAKRLVLKSGFNPKWFHLGGSYGLLNRLTAGCNLVRVGRALYGIDEHPARNATQSVAGGDTKTSNLKLDPVLQQTSTIVQIKKIKKGDKVGYGGTFVALKDMAIGVLPLGYNDGVDRRLSNRGVVTVDGVSCPIIGLISMNITTIDLSLVKDSFLGQVAVVFSDNPKEPNSVVNSSKRGQVLPHEMLIHIAESTKRVII
jgi:alanine racemase